ncbi:MAG TPA: response regulator [Thermodesulfovibrionales bacterium]|nr:response regulator [Thermodesulfovibrionales bacterium]
MKKVLVIDDEPFILMMIEAKLSEAGLNVLTLREGRDALSFIRGELPDLVILDWMMPGLSGIELCRMVKEDPELSHIPIFLLTAKGQDADKEAAFESGASLYITKPFSPKALLKMVNDAIGGQ